MINKRIGDLTLLQFFFFQLIIYIVLALILKLMFKSK